VRLIRAETAEKKAARADFARRMRDTHSFDARAAQILTSVAQLREARLAAE
jgi:hypothetical protein